MGKHIWWIIGGAVVLIGGLWYFMSTPAQAAVPAGTGGGPSGLASIELDLSEF